MVEQYIIHIYRQSPKFFKIYFLYRNLIKWSEFIENSISIHTFSIRQEGWNNQQNKMWMTRQEANERKNRIHGWPSCIPIIPLKKKLKKLMSIKIEEEKTLFPWTLPPFFLFREGGFINSWFPFFFLIFLFQLNSSIQVWGTLRSSSSSFNQNSIYLTLFWYFLFSVCY